MKARGNKSERSLSVFIAPILSVWWRGNFPFRKRLLPFGTTTVYRRFHDRVLIAEMHLILTLTLTSIDTKLNSKRKN